MPVPMPYYLEKGPFFAVLEDYVNTAPQEEVIVGLERLRAGDEWELFAVFASQTLHNTDTPDAAAWVLHLNEHWFGRTQEANTGAWAQEPFDAGANPETGYWQGYYGDVEQITRQTLIRALEVALGVDHATSGTISPTRRWPIEFLWKCSQAWFEGWVTWRRHGTGMADGHVTVVFATPPVIESVVLDNPLNGRQEREFRANPVNTKKGPPWNTSTDDSGQGMWVVTHNHNTAYQPVGPTTALGTLSGEWPSPIAGRVQGTGPIVTVAPSVFDGGVLADGLAYSV